MRPGGGVGRWFLSAFVVALASVGVARAADRVWTNPGGGSFNVSGNWQGGVVPSTPDTARFDYDGQASYMVYFDRPTNFGGAMVGDEQVTFDLRGSETRAVGKTPTGTSFSFAPDAGQRAAARVTGGGHLISNGKVVLAGNGTGTADVTVDGGATRWDAFQLTVGGAGTGRLHVSGGALLTTPGTGNFAVVIGEQPAARGEVVVTGPGSRWEGHGTLSVGGLFYATSGGEGTISVVNGGAMSQGASFYVGAAPGGTGRLVASGVNGTTRSTLQASDLIVGSRGTGTLLVLDGARADFGGARIGLGYGPTGSAVVGGEAGGFRAEMNVTTGLRVGNFLNNGPKYAGVLTVNDGGLVNVGAAVYLGSANSAGPLGTGTLNVHGGEVRTTQTLVVTTGAVNLDRGSITSGSQQVGYFYSTDATFNQNGGANSATTLQNGFGSGLGTYNLRGGTLTAKVTNAPGGTFNQTGGTLSGEVSNFGTWVASAPAAAGVVAVMADPAPTVTGTFTNQSTGTVRVNGAAARFDGEQFVNNGTFFSDAGGSRFKRFTLGATGSVRAVHGAGLTIGRELWVNTTDPARWDTTQARLSFDDAAGDFVTTYLASVPGADRGADASGLENNFACRALRVSAGDFVDFRPISPGHALYVGELMMDGGTDEFSHLHSATYGMTLYYDERLAGNAYLGGRRYRGIGVEIVPVPEPGAIVFVLACSACAVCAARG